ncbi:leucine-rich repeat-containing protein 3C [Crotalus adamanteus]|uniref:Leucine-rich repeat-containing protein 3C n=1 Tax=Crotalus adamanteus TaxID=8729 RepID=A0AAW1B4M2_CROAD
MEVGVFKGLSENLHSLDLSSNKLVSVNKDVFSSLKAKANLSNNPWLCDCTLQQLIERVELVAGTSDGIVCDASARKEHIGKPFLQLIGDIDFCNIYKKTTDIAMLVTMFGWFAMVISYLIYYVRQNQEDARRHLEYLKSLPKKDTKKTFIITLIRRKQEQQKLQARHLLLQPDQLAIKKWSACVNKKPTMEQ